MNAEVIFIQITSYIVVWIAIIPWDKKKTKFHRNTIIYFLNGPELHTAGKPKTMYVSVNLPYTITKPHHKVTSISSASDFFTSVSPAWGFCSSWSTCILFWHTATGQIKQVDCFVWLDQLSLCYWEHPPSLHDSLYDISFLTVVLKITNCDQQFQNSKVHTNYKEALKTNECNDQSLLRQESKFQNEGVATMSEQGFSELTTKTNRQEKGVRLWISLHP